MMPISPQDVNPDKVFKNELNAQLDKEAAQEMHIERVAQYAASLLVKDQELYPWTLTHFEEAMANAPLAARLLTFSYILDAVEHQLSNGKKNYLALTTLKYMVDTYWSQIAILEAEKHYAHE